MVAAILVALACSDRPRSNPFDPRNPDSQQRTAGFNALAGNGEVVLLWNPLNYIDVEGVFVERTVHGTSDTTVLNDSILPLGRLSFRDTGVENGITYSYRLRLALIGSEESPVTESDLATPGNLFPWISNFNRTAVTRLTPDFRDERYDMEIGFYFVADIQVRPDNSEIWVLDAGTASIYRFYPDGTLLPDQGSLGQNSAFRFNQNDRSLWLASWSTNSTIFHLGRTGELQASYRTEVFPTWICLDMPRNAAWIGTDSKQVLYLRNGNITTISHPAFVSPEKIVSGSIGSAAWVLDYDARAVFHLTLDQVDWNLRIFNNPQDIATNTQGDICWVADMDADIVYEIDSNSNILAQVRNVGRPTDLTYNHFDNTVLATGADGRITCIAPGGVVLWSTRLNHNPGQIIVQSFR